MKLSDPIVQEITNGAFERVAQLLPDTDIRLEMESHDADGLTPHFLVRLVVDRGYQGDPISQVCILKDADYLWPTAEFQKIGLAQQLVTQAALEMAKGLVRVSV